MALLEISKVSLSFSGLRALTDVSFDVAEGEIVGLIGPNGAGKSTLLNCISCLYRPESGQIRFEGRDLADRKSHQVAGLGIRRTFQNLELFREASVRENVTLGLVYRYKSPLLGEFFDLPSSRSMQWAAEEEANRILKSCGLSEVVRTSLWPPEVSRACARPRRPPKAAFTRRARGGNEPRGKPARCRNGAAPAR